MITLINTLYNFFFNSGNTVNNEDRDHQPYPNYLYMKYLENNADLELVKDQQIIDEI